MKTILKSNTKRRRGERGAALVTTLMLSTLLLAAGGALILSTSMAASTAFDATSETQAYYAAEAGLQAALNVVRGNIQPSPLFNSTASNEANNLTFRRLVTADNCNLSTETGASYKLRLSRWLSYNYPSSGTKDRITLTPVGSYSPLSGMAYSIEIQDPKYPTRADIDAKLTADSTYAPSLVKVISTGYGPMGAQKQLTMIVSRFMFDIQPPAPITIRGADDGTDMNFDMGSSSAKFYTGVDVDGYAAQKPTVAISLSDWNPANTGIKKGSTVADPEFGILDLDSVPSTWPTPSNKNDPYYPAPTTLPPAAKTPWFMETTDKARAFMAEAKSVAAAGDNYVTSYTGALGSDDDPGFLFVDGDCELDGGAGILFVTGALAMNGNSEFHGIIVVMGGGTVTRKGTGNGDVLGAWFVAKYDATGDFKAPTYDVSGGGNGNFKFSTNWTNQGSGAPGRRVTGLIED